MFIECKDSFCLQPGPMAKTLYLLLLFFVSLFICMGKLTKAETKRQRELLAIINSNQHINDDLRYEIFQDFDPGCLSRCTAFPYRQQIINTTCFEANILFPREDIRKFPLRSISLSTNNKHNVLRRISKSFDL